MLEYGLSESEYYAVVDYYSLHEDDDSMFEDFGDFNDNQLKFLSYILVNAETLYHPFEWYGYPNLNRPIRSDELYDSIIDEPERYINIEAWAEDYVEDAAKMDEDDVYEYFLECKEG